MSDLVSRGVSPSGTLTLYGSYGSFDHFATVSRTFRTPLNGPDQHGRGHYSRVWASCEANPIPPHISRATFCGRIHRDEAAFEVLVWRHGPTVLGVCRRNLRRQQEAEDVFHATFLVLVRK